MSAGLFALIIFSVSLNAIAQVVLRKAMLTIGPLPPLAQEPVQLVLKLISSGYLWAGMICYAISILSWLSVLARAQVSVAYPMLSIGYIIAAFLGVIFLNETVGIARVAGISMVCVGVYLIARTA